MSLTFEEKIRIFNGFTHIKMDIVNPIVLNADIEMKQFNIICGANNAGKTLSNKLYWASNMFFSSKMIAHITNYKDKKSDEEIFQFIMNSTFDDQKFEGDFEFYVRDELLKAPFYSVKYKIEEGNVKNILCDYPEDIMHVGVPIYLSTFSRDFSNFERYLKTKKMLGIEKLTDFESMEKLTEWFKFYDISAFENLMKKFEDLDNVISILDSVKTILGREFDMKGIEIDNEECKIYFINRNGQRKRLTSLGAGEQSIIIMMIAST